MYFKYHDDQHEIFFIIKQKKKKLLLRRLEILYFVYKYFLTMNLKIVLISLLLLLGILSMN
jgi:hypothetical protein